MSTFRVNTLSAADGTSPTTLTKQWPCKASFKYNGSTNVINYSKNIASITDAGPGQHNFTFTNNMDSVEYSGVATASVLSAVTWGMLAAGDTALSSSWTIRTTRTDDGVSNSLQDVTKVFSMVEGDLA